MIDEIGEKLMKPVTDATNDIATVFDDTTSLSGHSKDNPTRPAIFEPFVNATRDIPVITGNAVNAVLNLTRIVNQFSGLPWMTKFKEVADSAQSLIEDIHADAMDFYDV